MLLSSTAWSETFDAGDLAGTWYGHHVVSGDAPRDDPRWGYGTAEINSSGEFSEEWTSPGGAKEVSSGSIQIDTEGFLTINNQPLTHGVMNDSKDLFIFIDGTRESAGHAFNVFIRRAAQLNPGTNMLLVKETR